MVLTWKNHWKLLMFTQVWISETYTNATRLYCNERFRGIGLLSSKHEYSSENVSLCTVSIIHRSTNWGVLKALIRRWELLSAFFCLKSYTLFYKKAKALTRAELVESWVPNTQWFSIDVFITWTAKTGLTSLSVSGSTRENVPFPGMASLWHFWVDQVLATMDCFASDLLEVSGSHSLQGSGKWVHISVIQAL